MKAGSTAGKGGSVMKNLEGRVISAAEGEAQILEAITLCLQQGKVGGRETRRSHCASGEATRGLFQK